MAGWQRARCLAAASLGLVWVVAGWLPLWSERAESPAAIEARALGGRCILVEAAARAAGRRLLLSGLHDHDASAELLLRCAVRGRPLYAPAWLDLAEVEAHAGRRDDASRHARLAQSLWPHRPRLLWRVAVVHAQLGDVHAALDSLRAYLDAAPTRVGRAAWFAGRLGVDAETQVAALIPEGLPPEVRDARATAWLRVAEDPLLARPLWSRLSWVARGEVTAAGAYADALLALGAPEEAIAAWEAASPASDRLAGLANPGFEREPAQRGFGWRIRPAPAVGWQRDAEIRGSGDYSLQLRFGGERDDPHQAFQVVAVPPGAHVRLRGSWRGDLPHGPGAYVEVAARAGGPLRPAASRLHSGSWDWEPFEVSFEVPDHVRLVELRMRRRPNTRGSVWIDDLRLEIAESGHGPG